MKTLASLLLCSVLTGMGLALTAQDAPKEIAITAKRFTYEPNEVHLKKGEKVTLVLKTADVTHGLLCPKLGIRGVSIKPDTETRVQVTPAEAGTFTAICSHFCGAGHGNMKMKFVVE
jgi:cytochrome c oxidase subunit 2